MVHACYWLTTSLLPQPPLPHHMPSRYSFLIPFPHPPHIHPSVAPMCSPAAPAAPVAPVEPPPPLTPAVGSRHRQAVSHLPHVASLFWLMLSMHMFIITCVSLSAFDLSPRPSVIPRILQYTTLIVRASPPIYPFRLSLSVRADVMYPSPSSPSSPQ